MLEFNPAKLWVASFAPWFGNPLPGLCPKARQRVLKRRLSEENGSRIRTQAAPLGTRRRRPAPRLVRYPLVTGEHHRLESFDRNSADSASRAIEAVKIDTVFSPPMEPQVLVEKCPA